MRVALDLRSVQRRPWNGVGRALAHVLPRVAAAVELHGLTDAAAPRADLGVMEHPLRTPPPGLATAWLQWSAPRWLRSFDGPFHCPWYALPYRLPVPGVVTLYDLTFEHRPAWMGRAMLASYRVQARHAARVAAAVLTGSQTVAVDVIATYGVDPARVFVAPLAVDPAFRPDAARPDGLPDAYVVAMGGAPRRNLPVAVEAWARARTGLPLVVVGAETVDRADVHSLGRVDDGTWSGVLAHAEAFIYPTAYEGFGLPALEAAASGTPVVAARVGALPEVLGGAASWAAGLGPGHLAEALRRAVGDAELRAAGLAVAAARGGWEAAADAHVAAYELAAAP